MKAMLGMLLLLPALSGVVLAQEPNPPGSLTVLSRPRGAAFRMDGDRQVVGRTPMTLERGLAGRYQVRCIEPGYENWKRTVLLDGVSADTLWIALRPKTAWRAGVRSVIVPGWGQFYSERSNAGVGWLLAGGAAAGTLGALAWRYQQKADDSNAAQDPGSTATQEERDRLFRLADDAYRDRQIALGVAAGIWTLNLIDAVALFPHFHLAAVTMRSTPDGTGVSLVLAQVRIR